MALPVFDIANLDISHRKKVEEQLGKWRTCSTIIEPKCGNAARMEGIVHWLSEKAPPEDAILSRTECAR